MGCDGPAAWATTREFPRSGTPTRAARAYALDRYAAETEALAADVRYEQFVADAAEVVDLIGETVEMIWEYVEPDEIDDQDDERRSFRIVVLELEQRARGWVPIDPRYRPRREPGERLLVRI